MAYVPNSGSVVAFQSNPADLQASVTGTVRIESSVITAPVANQSVSGTVGASILGAAFGGQNDDKSNANNAGMTVTGFNYVYNGVLWDRLRGNSSIGALVSTGQSSVITVPTGTQNVSGSVVAFQGVSPWGVATNDRSVIAVVQGSIAAVTTPVANQSVSGTVGASIVGLPPFKIGTSTDSSVITVPQGSVAVAIVSGSIAASFTPPANQSVSGTVGASIIGLTPVAVTNSVNVNGSVAAFLQSTNASIITVGTTNVAVSSVQVASIFSIPGIVSAGNSTNSILGLGLTFTGTGEEVKDFASINVSVYADQASAVDGLSMQQSSDNSNWDIIDTYTIAAGVGKTFSVQPAARYFRIVYTNGGIIQTAFRLQTVYHKVATKPSSQRPSDSYTNETDLEQDQAFGMVFNGVNWDRLRGNSSIGALISTGASSVITRQSGTVITSVVSTVPSSVLVGASIFGQLPGGTAILGSVATLQGTNPWNVAGSVASFAQSTNASIITYLQAPSVVGTYAEDAVAAPGDKGIFALGVRNDTMSSVTSADVDYSQMSTGPVGEMITANAPINKWVQGTASMLGGTPVNGGSVAVIAAQGASIFTYITGLQITNASANNVWLRLDGATSSIIGFTVAPANGGSNIVFPNALKTNANAAFTASISGVASVYLAAQGFISKT